MLNSRTRQGITGLRTDADGDLVVPLPARHRRIDLILVSPLHGCWPAAVEGVEVAEGTSRDVPVAAIPIDSAFRCSLRRTCRDALPEDGRGIRIGIVDAGTTLAAGMTFVRALNTTGVEAADLTADNGSGHGTHVAGIVSRLVPQAEQCVYRVFAQDAERASEFAIAKAKA